MFEGAGEFIDPKVWPKESEQAILGAMLLHESGCDVGLASLEPSHFFSKSHQAMFTVLKIHREDGEGVDPVTVAAKLAALGRLEDIGGIPYFEQLLKMEHTQRNITHYAKRIREAWELREYVRLGKEAQSDDAVIEEIRLSVEKIQAGARVGQVARSGKLGDFAGLKHRKGVPTGFEIIDKSTTGKGLPVGQMSIVMSDTGGGKTAWSEQVAYNVAATGKRVCYATFADMDGQELADRMTKMICGWVIEPPMDHPDNERWHDAIRTIQALDITVYDATDLHTGRDVETFMAWFQAKHQKSRFDLLIVDYAQELQSRDKKARTMFDQAEICAHCMRFLAADTGVPVLVGSQMTEGKDGGKDITMGSRVWQNRAALVLKIRVYTDEERVKEIKDEEYKAIQGITGAHLLKNRFGRKNQKRYWKWLSETVSFLELS